MRIPFFTTRKALFLILTLQVMLVSAELGLSGQNHADSQPATDSYFPRGIFAASQVQRSDLIAEWFAGYLRKMNETPLFKSMLDADEFRLTRISPLGTEIIVRLNIFNNRASKLTVKVASGDGGMLINRTGDVTSEQVERFLHLVNDSGFWRLPSSELEEGQQVTDGEFWLLEGATHDNYHAVFRSNPKPSTYTELGRYLAELGKLDNSIFNTPEYKGSRVVVREMGDHGVGPFGE